MHKDAQAEFTASPFEALGYKNTSYYFYVKATHRIVRIGVAHMRSPWIFKLADIGWWRTNFGTEDKRFIDKVRWTEAASHCMTICHDIGEFQGVTNTPLKNWGK